MKARWVAGMAVTTLFVAVVCGPGVEVSPALADEQTAVVVAAMAVPAQAGGFEYVGTSKCKKCHIKEHRSWKKTKMGQAFETLKPGVASEAKQEHGLDSGKDYTTDAKCLKCHTTGFGHAGGYAVPDESDKKAVKKAKKLRGVGCESCHGPGSGYLKIFEDIFKSKRTYKVDELHAVGLKKMDAAACTECHNDQSPTFDTSKPFDFAAEKDKGTHEQQPLKQREG